MTNIVLRDEAIAAWPVCRPFLPAQSRYDYKIVLIRRKIRQLLGIAGRRLQEVAVVEQWIGISLDEAIRTKPSFEEWQSTAGR